VSDDLSLSPSGPRIPGWESVLLAVGVAALVGAFAGMSQRIVPVAGKLGLGPILVAVGIWLLVVQFGLDQPFGRGTLPRATVWLLVATVGQMSLFGTAWTGYRRALQASAPTESAPAGPGDILRALDLSKTNATDPAAIETALAEQARQIRQRRDDQRSWTGYCQFRYRSLPALPTRFALPATLGEGLLAVLVTVAIALGKSTARSNPQPAAPSPPIGAEG
jgi:hypothetical protein